MQLKNSPGGRGGTDFLTTRGGMITAAIIAAAVAALALGLAVREFRDSARDGTEPTSVLVAGGLIAKGTSGSVAGDQGALAPTSIAKDEVQGGAVADAAALRGRVAARDILPGQQITAADFTTERSGLPTRLAADQRAIAVPLDEAHGLIGDVRTGDRVDILVGFLIDGPSGRQQPVLRRLMQNILVLKAPAPDDGEAIGGRRGGGESQVLLRVKDTEAEKLVFSAENGKVWLALRPPTGSVLEKRDIVTLETLLAGATSVRGGR